MGNWGRLAGAPVLALAATVIMVGGNAFAQEVGGDAAGGFVATERAVLGGGTAAGWRSALFSGAGRAQDDGIGRVSDEFGSGKRAEEPDQPEGQPGNTGRKVTAGALSAVLPGAGQFYNGDKERGYVMLGIEAGIWTAYFVFDEQGDNRMESAEEWAGIYAGTDGEHDDSYWQSVGQYSDSDAYNDARYREARALQEEVSGLVGPEDAWQWVNDDRRYGYGSLRADGNSAYDRRDFMILFAVLNRAVSVYDAVRGAGRDADAAHARVLGLDVELQLSPALKDPGARCVVSRAF
jgi:hypothetical protein